jgi:hypothetical protein
MHARSQSVRNRLGTMFVRGQFDMSSLIAEDAHTLANVLKQYVAL